MPALFEAAFEHPGLLTRADIIERLTSGGWRLIEVKSTTSLKGVFVIPTFCSPWSWIGCSKSSSNDFGSVVRLRRKKARKKLFKLHDVLEQCETLLDTVNGNARKMQDLVASERPPNIQTGDHCFTPYNCPYYEYCSRVDVCPDHGIDELPSLRSTRRATERGWHRRTTGHPDDFPLMNLERIVHQTVLNQASVVYGDISAMLAEIKSPVRYLDFETFAPPIPRFVGPVHTTLFRFYFPYILSTNAIR